MIKIENVEVLGWEHVIRGMRNPMNSWGKSDSLHCKYHITSGEYCCNCSEDIQRRCIDGGVGPNDYELMMKLARGGPVHAKYRRMITVYLDITAPLYWWKEFDTYKVGTVANSCSTMHKIHDKEFVLDDFSHEHLGFVGVKTLEKVINLLNLWRTEYIETKDKNTWYQMIQLLPSSYNQKRTIMLNYEVLTGIYKHRREHKLDEWRDLCMWIEQLPCSEIITGEIKEELK